MRRHTLGKRGSACEGVGTKRTGLPGVLPGMPEQAGYEPPYSEGGRMTSRDSLPTTDRNEGVNRDREMRTDYPSV